ncbi:MAG: PEP-CTERM sorting domain-containing protein [Desulfobacterales bacterium]|nr:PEP-CTERM sorting domain-containing protein [Desulfobacterales bacterium]
MKNRIVLTIIVTAFCFLISVPAAFASAIWGTNAADELEGSRSSAINDGITANADWADGGISLSWNIDQEEGLWTYIYTAEVTTKHDVSHFILEVTDTGEDLFNIYEGTDVEIEGPDTFTSGASNPDMPIEMYGIKFDFGGDDGIATYTIVTDRAPVYGVFYAKKGKDKETKKFISAWSDALNYGDYRTNTDLNAMDFIVRPDGSDVPVPGAVWLFGSGLLGMVGLRRRSKNR